MNTQFQFSAGVWNLHPGADPFGPPVRPERDFVDKCAILQRLGFAWRLVPPVAASAGERPNVVPRLAPAGAGPSKFEFVTIVTTREEKPE